MDLDATEIIKIDDVTRDGSGVGRGADGAAVFVRGALPGDSVKVRCIKKKKRFCVAELVSVESPSPDRVESFCSLSESYGASHKHGCGGCPYSEIEYNAQTAIKRRQLVQDLERIGDINEPKVHDPIIMSAPFDYRNKVTMQIGWRECQKSDDESYGDRSDIEGFTKEDRPDEDSNIPVEWREGSVPVVGFFENGSHTIVDCPLCKVQTSPAAAVASAIRMFMMTDHISAYDTQNKHGILKDVVVRTCFATGEVMVIFDITEPSIPGADKLIDSMNAQISRLEPNMVSCDVIEGAFSSTSSDPNCEECKCRQVFWRLESVYTVTGKGKPVLLAGNPTIHEELSGVEYEISPLSFYQVNPQQTVKLYDKVLEYADLTPGDSLLDLYCGVGSIGIYIADRLDDDVSVLGIESNKGAVLDANRNAVINGIVNARYICGKAETVLPDLLHRVDDDLVHVNNADTSDAEFYENVIAHAKVAILDPPRKGCDEALLMAVADAHPERIVYVSCDPATLARDVKFLSKNGYKFIEATPVDMFPHTGHNEAVTLLVEER